MQNSILSHVIIVFFISNLSIISDGYASAQEAFWERVSVSYGINDSSFRMVKINPVNTDIVYVASPSAIYRTTDGGRTWKELVSLRRTAHSINTIVLDPLKPDIVYAGTETGLYKSNDGGANWRRIFRGIRKSEDSVLSVSISRHDPSIIFIGTESGIFRSVNQGKDWNRRQSFPSGTPAVYIVTDDSDPLIIYVMTDKELYKSPDSGERWTKIYSARLTAKGSEEVTFSDKKEVNGKEITIEYTFGIPYKLLITALAVNPADRSVLYISTLEGVMAGKEGGKSWTSLSRMGLTSSDIRQLAINTDDADKLYAATDRGGVRYSNAEKKWDTLYKGMTSGIIYHLDIAPFSGSRSTIIWTVTNRGVYKIILSGT